MVLDFCEISSNLEENKEKDENLFKITEQGRKLFDDAEWLSKIFEIIKKTFEELTLKEKQSLTKNKEKYITKYIGTKIIRNKHFEGIGFTLNYEARNESLTQEGYYDMKFQHSFWKNKYLVIECKILDSSPKRINNYVYVKYKEEEDGGLYRFLIDKYATGLEFGGMLGYIINDNPEQIISTLKDKIIKLKLKNEGKNFGEIIDENLLRKTVCDFPNSFQSNHTRINKKQSNNSIHIYHLFFDFTK